MPLQLTSGKNYYSEEEVESIRQQYQKTIADYRHDLQHIDSKLREEATDREWCSEFNEFVDEVNEGLKVYSLDKLESEYEVTLEVSRAQTQTVTLTISATDSDDARQKAYDLSESTVIDYADECDWDTHNVEWTVDDIEVSY